VLIKPLAGGRTRAAAAWKHAELLLEILGALV
jgi:hypothetical protein